MELKFRPKTDEELLTELSKCLTKAKGIVDALQIREAMLTINIEEGKKKRER